jgi:hypothetical protein
MGILNLLEPRFDLVNDQANVRTSRLEFGMNDRTTDDTEEPRALDTHRLRGLR